MGGFWFKSGDPGGDEGDASHPTGRQYTCRFAKPKRRYRDATVVLMIQDPANQLFIFTVILYTKTKSYISVCQEYNKSYHRALKCFIFTANCNKIRGRTGSAP